MRGSSPTSTQSALTSRQPAVAHLRVRLGEQHERRDAAEALLARREERADVAEPGRAEQRVDQRVREHVAVGVAGEAARVVELDAAEHERHALLERVRVDADADAEVRHAPAPPAARRASRLRRALGRVVQVAPRPAAHVHRRAGRPRARAARRCRRGRRRRRSARRAQPHASTTRTKNSGAGFSTPQSADDATKSTSSSMRSYAALPELPASPSR